MDKRKEKGVQERLLCVLLQSSKKIKQEREVQVIYIKLWHAKDSYQKFIIVKNVLNLR